MSSLKSPKATEPAANRRSGFTLVELLVVIAIIALLASILFPVLASVRDKARQTSCLSNQRQLGLGMMLYVQDYDEQYPMGLGIAYGKRVWAGEGWAGVILPYTRSSVVYRCPTQFSELNSSHDLPVSYGYNVNLVAVPEDEDDENGPVPPGLNLSALSSCSRTVMLFEVSGILANIADSREGTGSPQTVGRNYSGSGNGLDNRLYGQKDWNTRVENQYATGYIGSRTPPNPDQTQFVAKTGRHNGGANWLLADGHAKWATGSSISSGLNAARSDCNQDNKPSIQGCGNHPSFQSAGTNCNRYIATFSSN